MDTARISIPELLNGVSLHTLVHALESTNLDESGRVILLEGSAHTFCRGMDLSMLCTLQEAARGGGDLTAELAAFATCLRHIRQVSKPVIGVVEGTALAGGLGLLAACDLVLATTDATFGLSELLFGLVPAIIWPLLLERMPAQKVRRWALAARTYSAHEALAAGFVDVVVSPADLARTVRTWVRYFSRVDPAAVGQLKHLSATSLCPGLEPALRHGVEATAESLGKVSVRRRIQRFVHEGIAPWEAR